MKLGAGVMGGALKHHPHIKGVLVNFVELARREAKGATQINAAVVICFGI